MVRQQVVAIDNDCQKRRFNEFVLLRQSEAVTSWQMVALLIKDKGWNKKSFCDNTLLDEFVYDRAMSNHKSTPGFRTLIAISAGMDIGLTATDTLLGASGFRLGNSREHLAYEFIIRDMAGMALGERNDFLISMGIAPLGSRTNKNRSKAS